MKRYRRMTTAQLDELLQAELRKVTPDEEVALPILEVLEEREQKPRRKNRQIIRWGAVAAVLALLIAVVPKVAGTDSLWDMVLHVTDNFLQFFAPGDTPNPTEAEYIFETDNPGLQQLYDKVAELGITAPVVPMWLPEGHELTAINVSEFVGGVKISASFKMDDNEIVIIYKISDEISSDQYERADTQVEIYEEGRVKHTIMENAEKWTVSWVKDNIGCLVTAKVNKADIYRIIQSIYWRNEK